MVVEKMSKEMLRKLRIENLEKGCLNCLVFLNDECREPYKENICDCLNFVELPESKQVVVVKLSEWSR
jgi:hypothetical protein